MARIPFADQLLIPPGSNDPRITARLGILHVDATNSESLYRYFNGPSGGIESHLFVKKSGVLEQYRDTAFQADANLDANDFAISVETQGFGDGEWTDEQIETIKRVMLWCANAPHGPHIPLQVAKSWDGTGWGYHTMWGAPSHWTPVAKTCPGPLRIEQFNDVLVPWMKTGGAVQESGPTPNITAAFEAKTPEERKAALRKVTHRGTDDAQQIAAEWLDAIARMERVRAKIKKIRADLRDEEVKA